ncbi:MAG: transporter [Dehalococcoidales bacterium]|nr:transporter [Dehalococcoidales bacterium]
MSFNIWHSRKDGAMSKREAYPKQDSPSTEVLEPYRQRYRWVMLALVWLLYFVFGVVTASLAPLITPILKDLGISYSQMGFILGSWPLTYIVVSIMAGALMDRWGIRKSVFVGIIIVGLSEILRYFANGFGTMLLCVTLFGLGGPMISIGCPKVVAVWFHGKERGMAAGAYMTGNWIGALTAYSTANSLVMPITGYSWRLTFVIYSLLPFAAALLWWWLARDIKTQAATGSVSIIKVFASLIRVRTVQLVLVMGFFFFAVTHGFNEWLPKLLETGGLPPTIAGFAASIPLFIGIPAVFVIPRLAAPHLRGRIIILTSLGMAIAMLVVTTQSGIPLVMGLGLYGLSFPSIMPILMLVLMDLSEVGSRYMGSAAGMFFCVAEIGGFAGPFLMGTIKDWTGGFIAGAAFLAVLALALSAMALFLKSKHPVASKAQ